MCIENSCRSQIAEGFAKQMGKSIIDSYSAGSRPSGMVNPNAVKVMKELGVDISLYKSKTFDALPVKKFDFVVHLGCKDACPFVPAYEHIYWDIDDPSGKDIDFFRKVRDNIKNNIKQLILKVSAQDD